jgi:hypothetical protein
MLDPEDVIAIAEHEWRAMGVVERDRAALADDLRLELRAAIADGATPQQLFGDDVRAFARRLATEAGARRLPYQFKRLLLSGLVGAMPGAVIGWIDVWYLPWMPGVVEPSVVGLLLRYTGLALLVLAGALVTIRIRMADVPGIGRTVAAMAVLVPIAGLLITPVTMGFAAMAGYSTALPVILFEMAIVAGALAGATVLARRWALAPALRAHRNSETGLVG